jgi:hypothetical protein
MSSVVWSGHLNFGLVVMPVRLLVAARTKTTRFRRLYRKPVSESNFVNPFPSFSHDAEDQDSEVGVGVRPIPSTRGEMADRDIPHEYSTVRPRNSATGNGEGI